MGGRTTNFPAAYMLVRKENKLLFLLRTNTGFMDGYYCLPSGRVEPGEAYRAAAVRETMEEVAVTVQPEHARQFYTQQRYQADDHIWTDVFFVADEWSGEPKNALPEEHGEITWFDIDSLPEDKIMDYQMTAIRAFKTGETYGEFNFPDRSQTGDAGAKIATEK